MLMIVIENECVDCGLPCIYELCQYYQVMRFYCDSCGDEENLWHFDGEQLCLSCILDRLERVEHNE